MRQPFCDQPHVQCHTEKKFLVFIPTGTFQCLSHHITCFSFELLIQKSKEVGICWVQGLGQIMDRQGIPWAVCTEADEGILDAQLPDHGATVKKAISDVMRRCKL